MMLAPSSRSSSSRTAERVVVGVGVVAVGVRVATRPARRCRGAARRAGCPGWRRGRTRSTPGRPAAAAAARAAGVRPRRGSASAGRSAHGRPGDRERRLGAGLGGRVDDRLDPPVVADHVDRGLAHDLLAAAAVKESRAPALTEARRQRLVVDRDHLGVLAEQDPGQPALSLTALEHVGPQPAYVDQGRARSDVPAGGARHRRPARASAVGLGGLGRASARARRARPARPPARRRGGRRRAPARALDRRGGSARPPAGARPRGGGAAARRGRRGAGVPLDRRSAARAGRAGPSTPSVAWSAPGSSTRAQISSSSSRGAVAPRISVRPSATRSAARLSSARPNRAACAASRSAWSSGHVDQPGRRRVGDRGDDHQVAQPAQQVLGEPARVLPGLDHLVDDPEHRGAVAGRERVDDLVEQRVGRVAEQAGGRGRR